jgi:2,4-dienoyl-CoA reductase-like NADH-dependent reductase (Old Yellow Enzyme family)
MLNKSKVDAISEFRKMSLTDMRKCLRLFGQNADSAGSELVEIHCSNS